MQVIEVNGKNLIVGSNNDIIDIIRERCGDELADLVSEKLSRGDLNEVYAKEALNTDLRAYESEAEESLDAFNTIYDELTSIKSLMQIKGNNSKKIKEYLQAAIDLAGEMA